MSNKYIIMNHFAQKESWLAHMNNNIDHPAQSLGEDFRNNFVHICTTWNRPHIPHCFGIRRLWTYRHQSTIYNTIQFGIHKEILDKSNNIQFHNSPGCLKNWELKPLIPGAFVSPIPLTASQISTSVTGLIRAATWHLLTCVPALMASISIQFKAQEEHPLSEHSWWHHWGHILWVWWSILVYSGMLRC